MDMFWGIDVVFRSIVVFILDSMVDVDSEIFEVGAVDNRLVEFG